MECPSCHSEMPDDSRFCEACGAALTVRCSSCGATSRAGARFCSKCGTALAAESSAKPALNVAQSKPPTVSAERRQLTVMFCDLVGSTALSSRVDPEDMREIIGAYHGCCAEQITKAGGFVAQYLGDGVLAYFGYPEAHEDDAERAVRTGLVLVDSVSRLRAGRDTALQTRIGIATGLVVVGDLVGARERGVVGETPNLAARLQALAEPGQVVISQSTRRLAGGLFEYRDLGRVTLKGLADPTQAWQVIGPSIVESRFEAQHETNLTPLVGREEELELLLRRWRQAASGEGRVVLLSGEPGIGKSRLTVALEERLQDEPHTRMRYFCSPQHTDSAFYPVVRQLERAAEFERHDTPEAKLDKLTCLLGASSDQESETQLIAELLSIPTADRYAPLNVSPQRKKEKTFEALLGQLEENARDRPVLMVYEDVHWIDPSSRDLLGMVVERVPSLPVLLLITFRPDFQAPWTSQAHVFTLILSRLARREGAAIVEQMAGNNSLPEKIVDDILGRADGIPLFVEELTKAVLEAGPSNDDAIGVLSAEPPTALSVPATLHASLMARLDHLGAAAKEIAQAGAAIGREFSYDLLTLVAQRSELETRAALERLSEAGLVFRRGALPQANFLFKHALVQDAAYGTLLRGKRQELHARIASALEDQFKEVVAVRPELLARHCAEGGFVEKAVGYWLQAVQQAISRNALAEAERFAKHALALDPDNVEALVGLAFADDAITATFATDKRATYMAAAEAAARKALTLAPNHVGAHTVLGSIYMQTNRAALAVAEFEEAVALDPSQARPYASIGWAQIMLGRAEETEDYIVKALRQSPSDYVAYQWCAVAGAAKLYIGRDDEAVAWLHRSVEANRSYPLAQFALAAALGLQGKTAEARAAVAAGLALNPSFTIQRFRAGALSDHPTYLAQRDRFCEGMRKAGVPEE
jgi:class 3 adenylate cyclase/tetratricopeptide (TPR) repeat protein